MYQLFLKDSDNHVIRQLDTTLFEIESFLSDFQVILNLLQKFDKNIFSFDIYYGDKVVANADIYDSVVEIHNPILLKDLEAKLVGSVLTEDFNLVLNNKKDLLYDYLECTCIETKKGLSINVLQGFVQIDQECFVIKDVKIPFQDVSKLLIPSWIKTKTSSFSTKEFFSFIWCDFKNKKIKVLET